MPAELSKKEKQNKINNKIKELVFIERGRINRIDFFFGSICLNAIQDFLEYATKSAFIEWIIIILSLTCTYIGICLITKRFRDIGISGWFALPYTILVLIAYIFTTQTIIYWLYGLIVIVIMGLGLTFWPREKHDNKYGPYEEWGIMDSRKLK